MATVTLSSRPGVYELPSYSLTGDLLGYLRCGLQYRYTRLGKMPSRSPVQLWFGNFIHGVLDEGFRIYDQAIKAKSPPAKALAAIDPVAVIATIEKRLAAQGLVAWEPWLKTLGYARAQVALRDLAPVLFPLIHRSEVRLTGARELKPLPKGTAFREADRYEMVGVIDVVTDIQLAKPDVATNPIVKLVQGCLGTVPDHFEVIIDYKGSRRPSLPPAKATPKHPSLWDQYEWQVLTYADLRGRQPDAHPVKAGLLLYINELLPLASDLEELRRDVRGKKTDVGASDADIASWLQACRQQREAAEAILETATKKDDAAALKASAALLPSPIPWDRRLDRSLRIVPVDDPKTGASRIPAALTSFDDVVEWIETCRGKEFHGKSITAAWDCNTSDESTCAACDARTWCPAYASQQSGAVISPQLPAVRTSADAASSSQKNSSPSSLESRVEAWLVNNGVEFRRRDAHLNTGSDIDFLVMSPRACGIEIRHQNMPAAINKKSKRDIFLRISLAQRFGDSFPVISFHAGITPDIDIFDLSTEFRDDLTFSELLSSVKMNSEFSRLLQVGRPPVMPSSVFSRDMWEQNFEAESSALEAKIQVMLKLNRGQSNQAVKTSADGHGVAYSMAKLLCGGGGTMERSRCKSIVGYIDVISWSIGEKKYIIKAKSLSTSALHHATSELIAESYLIHASGAGSFHGGFLFLSFRSEQRDASWPAMVAACQELALGGWCAVPLNSSFIGDSVASVIELAKS